MSGMQIIFSRINYCNLQATLHPPDPEEWPSDHSVVQLTFKWSLPGVFEDELCPVQTGRKFTEASSAYGAHDKEALYWRTPGDK